MYMYVYHIYEPSTQNQWHHQFFYKRDNTKVLNVARSRKMSRKSHIQISEILGDPESTQN